MNSRRRPDASVLTSPVLIGALTVLITIIAVALAYNVGNNRGSMYLTQFDGTRQTGEIKADKAEHARD